MKRIITTRMDIGRMKIISKIPDAWKHSIAQMTLPYLQVIVQTQTRERVRCRHLTQYGGIQLVEI